MEGIYVTGGTPVSEDIPLMEFAYLVFTHTAGGVAIGE